MNLMELLPGFYQNAPETTAIQAALGRALDTAWATRDDCFKQLDLTAATWGLDLWEKAYGIAKEAGKADEFRRARIMARMRGAGTTTAKAIQSVAESFTNGAVAVQESPRTHRVDIVFVGTLGVPPQLDDLKRSLAESIPAHLALHYTFIYRTWGQVADRTWADAGTLTWAQLRGGTPA